MTPAEFIAHVRAVAVEVPGINPEATAAHAALESGYGASQLASRHGNLFGLKAGSAWAGETVHMPTWEVIDGKNVNVEAEFRAYPSWVESVEDYAATLARLYPWAVRCAEHPVAFLAGVYVTGPYRWATDPQALSKAVAVLDAYDLLATSPAQERLGRHEVVVDNSPTIGKALVAFSAALGNRPAVYRSPHDVTRTRRPNGSWKVDLDAA